MLQLTFNPGLTLTGFRTTQPWKTTKYKEEKTLKLLPFFQLHPNNFSTH